MLAILPGAFLCLAVLNFRLRDEWRLAIMKGAIVFGVAVVVNTEVLSVVRQLSEVPDAALWTIECFAGALVDWRHRAELATRLAVPWPRGLPEAAFVVAIAVIVLVVGVIAVVAPPNSYDSMTYHLARVTHWIADGTVVFYPTNAVRQLYESPWAEDAVLQLQLLSRTDALANLVQWLSMVGSLGLVTLLARELGAGRTGEVLAAVAAVTLPMGILEASSTQTDYVESFWLGCCILTALLFVKRPSGSLAFWLGASLGLAMLTKGTAYVLAAPIVILVAGWMIFRLRTRMLVPAVVMIAVPLAINAPQFVRNQAMFHNPLAPASESARIQNATFSPAAIGSNLIRDSVLQVGTPLPSVNGLLDRTVGSIHRHILHIDISDPRTTWPDTPFAVNPLSFDEDYAGDPLQAVLALVAVLMAFLFWRSPLLPKIYAASLVLAFLLFAAYLKWQPWHSRLELPILMLACPLIGAVITRHVPAWSAAALAGILLLAAVPWVINNDMRPMVGFALIPRSNLLPPGQTIFTASRTDLYFAKRPELEGPYSDAVKQAAQDGCHEIGLWSNENDWEYPLWVLSGGPDGGTRVDQVLVRNASASANVHPNAPCLVVATVPNAPASVQVGSDVFTQLWIENGVAVYRRSQ